MLFQARELPERESAQIRRHLRYCACCSAVASELRELERIAGYAMSTSVAAPACLDMRVMAAVTGKAPAAVRFRPLIPLPWRLRRLAFAALALFLLAGAYAMVHWVNLRDVNDRLEAYPPPVRCNTDTMVPSIHALPHVNGRIVLPSEAGRSSTGTPPTGMAAVGHMRKHGKNCRCWEGRSSSTGKSGIQSGPTYR